MICLNKAFVSKRCTQDHINFAVQNFAAIDGKASWNTASRPQKNLNLEKKLKTIESIYIFSCKLNNYMAET